MRWRTRALRRHAVPLLVALVPLAGCGEGGGSPIDPLPSPPELCAASSAAPRPVAAFGVASGALPVTGLGAVPDLLTSELSVRGAWAYTGTYGSTSRGRGNVLKVWDVSGAAPVLHDEVVIEGASTLGDVQVSDDGGLLVVATEFSPGSIVVFDLADPAAPRQLSRFAPGSTRAGVHTATLARVDGRLHAFLAVDPGLSPSRLVVVDLGDPGDPREVLVREMGTPFIHDVFVREGLLFTALWNGGTVLWDIGGGGKGGSVSDPVRMAALPTVGGQAHNVWWSGCGSTTVSPRYVFIGQEGPGGIGTSASGDVHVVDIGDLAAPREVAYFTVPGAGAHNFSVDEESGVLYAAFYNAGVKALDVSGDLSACVEAERESAGGRCDLWKMERLVGEGLEGGPDPVYVWGVHWQDGRLFASDMLNGLWALDASGLGR